MTRTGCSLATFSGEALVHALELYDRDLRRSSGLATFAGVENRRSLSTSSSYPPDKTIDSAPWPATPLPAIPPRVDGDAVLPQLDSSSIDRAGVPDVTEATSTTLFPAK